MYDYEMMCIFNPNATSAAETTEAVEAILNANGAQIEKKDDMGLRKLAYPIKKKNEGHYWLYNFKLEPSRVTPVNKELLIKEGLMRYLLIRSDD